MRRFVLAVLFATCLPAAAHAAPELRTLAAGLDVKDRQLVGQATWFHTDEQRIWVHATLANEGPEETIAMVWKREGTEMWRVVLKVGTSKRWRTWSRKRIPDAEAGRWTVEIRDGRDRLLGKTRFVVEDEPGC